MADGAQQRKPAGESGVVANNKISDFRLFANG